MDYILADRHMIPAASEAYYCERVLRMPHGYACYDPPADAPPPGPLPARQNGFVRFGGFHMPSKIHAQMVATAAVSPTI